jgi:hypothetical protein
MMIPRFACGATALAIFICLTGNLAHAANPLPAESRLVSASGAPAPTQLAFTIASAEDLQVTLTDLKIPAALLSAEVVVTQGDAVVGEAVLASPATTATFSITGAVGAYTLWVFGHPGASDSVGTFTACVAPKSSPSACISSASLAGNITEDSAAANPALSTLSTQLTVKTQGSYTFNFSDFQFPVALSVAPGVALFQGSTAVQPLPIPSGTAITLSPGVYTLLAIAQADQTAQAGLYGITITGPAGTTPLLDTAVSVGQATQSSPFDNSSAQSVTLKVTDFSFPSPLGSASAMLTSGGTSLGQASAAGGATTIAAPAGGLQLWTYATPGTAAGTYEVDVLAGANALFTTAQGVSPSGGTAYAYAFVTPTVAAGSYKATAGDLQFPAALPTGGFSFAVAQYGVILEQSASAATLDVTAAAGPLVFLVSAQAPTAGTMSGNGLFDVNLQASGASPQFLYDKTQSVSSTPSVFDSQLLTLGVDASFSATLADLKTPAAFDNLALVVSQGTSVLGKIYGGGTFSFAATPGTYQLTFVASPAAQQQFGMYGVAVVFSPPTIGTFTSSASSATTGTTVTLTWSTANATSCTGSGGGWTGSGTSGSQALVLSATTTYTLSCTGAGGTSSQSVTVKATAAPSSGGGGAVDLTSILMLLSLWTANCCRKLVWRPRPALSLNGESIETPTASRMH